MTTMAPPGAGAPVLDLAGSDPEAVPARPIGGGLAWKAADLTDRHWRTTLDSGSTAEAVAWARADIPPEDGPEALPALRRMMDEVRERLVRGPGFVVIGGLPLAALGEDRATRLYGRLGSMLAPLVATKHDGTMFYRVTDEGRAPGYGVRGSSTRDELTFHTDNAFGRLLPDFVGLLCVHSAAKGGVSRVASLHSAHDAMLAEAPELLRRLYGPALFDRQAEHGPEAPKVLRARVFELKGDLLAARLVPRLIHRGYEMAGHRLDPELAEALARFQALLSQPCRHVEFRLEPGEMLFLSNHGIAHARSPYVDEGTKRLLIRTWYREEGGPGYDGEAPGACS